jgi:hypothetical protein
MNDTHSVLDRSDFVLVYCLFNYDFWNFFLSLINEFFFFSRYSFSFIYFFIEMLIRKVQEVVLKDSPNETKGDPEGGCAC